MKNLLEYILIHLVEFPEEVRIDEEVVDDTYMYTIKVNEKDIGRVIGKNGSVIKSIRNIAKIRAIKEGIRARVEIDDGRSAQED